MTAIAAIGHISRDVVAGAAPRPGGGVYYAARALAHLRVDARIAAACAAAEREELLPPLVAFGHPVAWYESTATTAYRFHYEGDRRIMWQDAVGDPWSPADAVEAVGDAEWIDVCALTRTDFAPATVAALAAGGRRLLVDAQGLVRTASIGPLELDGDVGDVLRAFEIMNLNDDEAEVLVGSAEPGKLRVLGIPEVLLTLGSRGSWVVTSELLEYVPAVARRGPVDPTGSGDTYAVAYLARRAEGAEPVEAARAAAETAAALLVVP